MTNLRSITTRSAAAARHAETVIPTDLARGLCMEAGFDSDEAQGRDSADFATLAVWEVRALVAAAYAHGVAAGRKG